MIRNNINFFSEINIQCPVCKSRRAYFITIPPDENLGWERVYEKLFSCGWYRTTNFNEFVCSEKCLEIAEKALDTKE